MGSQQPAVSSWARILIAGETGKRFSCRLRTAHCDFPAILPVCRLLDCLTAHQSLLMGVTEIQSLELLQQGRQFLHIRQIRRLFALHRRQ